MKVAAALGDFHALHPVSALTKDGVGELRDDLVSPAAGGAAVLPGRASRPTSRPRTAIAEVVREKALHLTRDEVPHAITVEIDEIGDKLVRAFVLVETESQKGILVGKKGAMIREIGSRARPEVEHVRSATRSSSSSSSRCARNGAATRRCSRASVPRTGASRGSRVVSTRKACQRPVGSVDYRLSCLSGAILRITRSDWTGVA